MKKLLKEKHIVSTIAVPVLGLAGKILLTKAGTPETQQQNKRLLMRRESALIDNLKQKTLMEEKRDACPGLEARCNRRIKSVRFGICPVSAELMFDFYAFICGVYEFLSRVAD